MQAAQIAKQGSSYHDVVEMRHHKVSVTDMHVYRQRCQKQSGHATNCEQSDEAKRVEHRRVVRDSIPCKALQSIEDFYGEGIATAKLRKEKICPVNRLAGDKQVVTPHENPNTAIARLEKATNL